MAVSFTVFDAAGKQISQQSIEERPDVTNRQALTDQAAAALATNRTFLALASPTNAQIAAQVKALTRQNNALVRLALGLLDGTD